jgi:hypothetical protein
MAIIRELPTGRWDPPAESAELFAGRSQTTVYLTIYRHVADSPIKPASLQRQ